MRSSGARFGPHVIRAFLTAPLVPAAALVVVFLGYFGFAVLDGSAVPRTDDFWSLFHIGASLTAVSYLAAVLFGVPAYWLLTSIRRVGIIYAILGGLVIGSIVSCVVVLMLSSDLVELSAFEVWPFSAAGAVLSSIAFWLIARPDRLDANCAARSE